MIARHRFPLRVTFAGSTIRAGPLGAWRVLFAGACANLLAAAWADNEPRPELFSPYAVWFPPTVPVSGEPIAAAVWPNRTNARLPPPSGLADFVNETFYPPLSTRLYAHTLRGQLQARLDQYREKRGTLVNELADRIAALHGVEDEARTTELRAFALQQTPRIAALETEADELRRDLVDGGVLQLNVDWSRKRRWTLGVTRFAGEHFEKEAQFQVVRAAAYYQAGLTAEQRGLLLEIAFELQTRARAARPIPAPRRGDPAAMFFSPELARMRLPKNVSQDLLSRIGRYNSQKTALKQELRDAVFEHDKTPPADRIAVFSALADSQWPKLIELEKLAEEIRIALTSTPAATLPAPPHIPAQLMVRIEDYNRDRRRFIQEFEQAIRAASSMVVTPRVDFKQPEDVRMQLARKLAEDRAALRERVARSFHEQTRERFEAMRVRYEEIQSDLKLIAAGQFDPETGRPLNSETLLRNYSVAMDRFDTFGREEVIYRGYRTAMLMPGLSPEQRRLLFGAAIVGLAQPLPFGELLPTEAQPVPRS